MDLTSDQHARSQELRKAGLKPRDAKALVYLWDRIPLERRLAMFEAAGNEEEAAIVRARLEQEKK